MMIVFITLIFMFISANECKADSNQTAKYTSGELLHLIDPSEKTHSSHLPACYRESKEITNKTLTGRWVNGTTSHRGTFATQQHLKSWWLNACPVQVAKYSCSFHDHSDFEGHGYEASHLRYKLEDCSLLPFVPTLFLRAVKNRNLFLCCDSSSAQIFITLVCSLHGATTAEYNISWADRSKIFTERECVDETAIHCDISTASVFYPEYSFTIRYQNFVKDMTGRISWEQNLEDFLIGFGRPLHKYDILLLNYGLHAQPVPEHIVSYVKTLEQLARNYSLLPEQNRFTLIWRESWAQHFDPEHEPSYPLGYYAPENRYPCVDIEKHQVSQLRRGDFRNKIANRIMTQYGIPIIRIHTPSIFTALQHVGQQHRRDEVGRYDCTHYCDTSGYLFLVRDIIYNAFAVMFNHRRQKQK